MRYVDVSMMLLAVAFFFALTAWQERRDNNAETAREVTRARERALQVRGQSARTVNPAPGGVAVSAIRSGGPQREGKHVLSLESEPDQHEGTA